MCEKKTTTKKASKKPCLKKKKKEGVGFKQGHFLEDRTQDPEWLGDDVVVWMFLWGKKSEARLDKHVSCFSPRRKRKQKKTETVIMMMVMMLTEKEEEEKED